MKAMNFDFVGKKKWFALFSLVILMIGLVCNIVLKTQLDIQFAGGTIAKYSYTGDITEEEVHQALQGVTDGSQTIEFSYDVIVAGELTSLNYMTITLSTDMSTEELQQMTQALEKAFEQNNIVLSESSTVEATMGRDFFIKCLVAIALAAVLMLIYVAIRFRKIGGWSAGLMALVALLHDILIAYFAFVIFGIELDDNFVAVVLSILGYSLNSTIVIFDRIRENRRLMGGQFSLDEIVNKSINQSFKRALHTSISTFIAVSCITGVALFYGLDSILSFSIPMMVGIAFGFYSSVFLSTPLWVGLRNWISARKAAKAV